ncbi:MAG: taurine dioxygenase [Actinomycetota bacterium]|jgi:taurine dioxygenase
MTVTADLNGLLSDYHPGPRVYPRTPDGWAAAPYTRFDVAPLTPTIGAVILGVSLAAPVDAELFDQLNRALLEWKVLFFRDQDITGDQHAAFAANWGPLEAHPFIKLTTDQSHGKAEVVRFEKGPELGGYENVWHSDVTWREVPSLGSVLRAIEVPDVGGDTMWSDMCAAYDGLDDATKERIEGLVAEHDWLYSFGLTMKPAERDALRVDFPPAHHPVVRTHPETGRKMLYVNRGFTQFIVGMDPDESRALLEQLWIQASFGEYQCRWKWQPGDVAFWDNRSTQHYAVSDYFPNRRVMERITIIGDKPF